MYNTYIEENLRYSQNAALDMYKEVNTGSNLPAQIDLYSVDGEEYKFLCIAKGGGSANKTYLYQETKALLSPGKLKTTVDKMRTLGTAACPPYHVAFVIGGTSAEATLKTVKLASTKYYDGLPTEGNEHGGRSAIWSSKRSCCKKRRTRGWARSSAANTSRTISAWCACRATARPARSAWASPARRTATSKARSTATASGWKNWSTTRVNSFLRSCRAGEGEAIKVDLNRPMAEILKQLSQYPVSTRLSLSGTIIVGRDIAHAKLKERLDRGEGLPQYVKDHPIYYAGPAKTPEGYASGSLGPTTAGRMDSYVDLLQSHGGSMIMLAKGNRSQQVTDACHKHGGFYLGSIGGPAAVLAQQSIKSPECVEYPELGMEAIWKIEVEDFPAFIPVDDKGNDFFQKIRAGQCSSCLK